MPNSISHSRHIPEDLAVRSRLGYATGHQLVEALQRQRVPLEAAFQLGLLYGPASNPVEHFRERLVIPEIRHGQPVWLTGRLIPTPELQANRTLLRPGSGVCRSWPHVSSHQSWRKTTST